MLKKPVCWSFAMMLSLTTSAKSLADNETLSDHSSSQPTKFPSKTYFLMVVDRYLMKNIQRDDVARLLKIDHMEPVDEVTIYRGMRKAMLRNAAQLWDAGEISSYNGNVAHLMGWNSTDTGLESRVQNRLFVFRYAQASEKSRQLLKRYSKQLNDSSFLTDVKTACHHHIVPKLDYDFYRILVETTASHHQALDLALRYESLSPVQRCSLADSIEGNVEDIDEDSLSHSIAKVGALSNKSLMASFSSQDKSKSTWDAH